MTHRLLPLSLLLSHSRTSAHLPDMPCTPFCILPALSLYWVMLKEEQMARKAELSQDLRTFYTYYVGIGAQNSSDRTLCVYKETLESYYRFLEATLKRPPLLSDMDVNTARAWAQHLKERKAYAGHPTRPTTGAGLSSHTIQRHVRTLKAFSSWLVKDEKVEDALLAKLKRYKVARRVIATLSDDESGRIFEALDTRTKLGACDYALVFLLLGIPGLEPVNCAG